MLIQFTRFTLLFLCSFVCLAHKEYPQEHPQKSFTSSRTTNKPIIDGFIESEVWTSESVFFDGNFIQMSPSNGEASDKRSKVHFLYDDFGIYIAAQLYDEPTNILKELGVRDSWRNADYFSVGFDPYLGGQNAFVFFVSAAGVQNDLYLTARNEDDSWDAVWNSAVKINAEGWAVEMFIPYSALRFPKEKVQDWGINFGREVKAQNEQGFWNYVNPNVSGFVTQFGKVLGLKNIKPPFRLFLSPYLSTYYTIDPANNINEPSITGGMDLKLGLNESYTLDMTLIPDFGQVVSDNLVLNLSPFEVRFQENRPFFTEGVDLFDVGDLFYSRRVGETYDYVIGQKDTDELVKRENKAPLINATKLSGRGKNGFGLGFFNAVSNETYAIVRDTTTKEERSVLADPISNFNAIALNQNLPNNSNLALINTNVWRANGARRANVTALSGRIRDKNNVYQVRFLGGFSQVFEQDENSEYQNTTGGRGFVLAGKLSGLWQYWGMARFDSDNYDINDLGFLNQNNVVNYRAQVSYNQNTPKGNVLSVFSRLRLSYNMLYKPYTFTDIQILGNTFVRIDLNDFWLNMNAFYQFRPITEYDYFEAREANRVFVKPPSGSINFWMGTDERKRLSMELFGGMWTRPTWQQIDNWNGAELNFRFDDKMSLGYGMENLIIRAERGYAIGQDHNADSIMIGIRNRNVFEHYLRFKYTFNNRMNLDLRARHYWAQVRYADNEFNVLNQDGSLAPHPNYAENHDDNFNNLNIDMIFSWQIAPGSFVSVAWKNQVVQSSNQTFNGYLKNFRENISQQDQFNSLSVRLIYFLDYVNVKRQFSKRVY